MNIDTKNYLLGKNQKDLTKIEEGYLLHRDVISSYHLLKERCSEKGFDLTIASSYRSFDQQKKIWNEKALGNRVLLDDTGLKLDFKKLSQQEILLSILRWSAIPGFSRHHWGTEIDIYCRKSLPSKEYNVQLIPEEVNDDGMFGELHQYLDELIQSNNSCGFYRPYCEDRGGVAPERWHLSYAPISSKNEELVDLNFFRENISTLDIELAELIQAQIEFTFDRFVHNTCLPPFEKQ